jgi:hypothetical protein
MISPQDQKQVQKVLTSQNETDLQICSSVRSQQVALFLNFILLNNMFRTDLLSIIRSLNTVSTANGICHTSYVDCLLADSQQC